MKLRALGGTVVAAALLTVALPATATSAAGTSSFDGVIYGPERGGTTAVVRGDLNFDPSVCPNTIGDMSLPSYPAYDERISVGLFPDGWNGSGDWNLRGTEPGSDESPEPPEGGSYFDERYWDLVPGVYRFVVAGFYVPINAGSSRWITCQVLNETAVSVVERTSLGIETAATPLRVTQGEAATVHLDYVETWSDGVITRKPAPERLSYQLQSREVGTFEWVNGPSSYSPTFTVSPKVMTEYRVLLWSRLSEPVTIDVIGPTLARRIISLTVTPTTAIAGSATRLAATVETMYSDGTWKPSPAGTQVQVQFLPQGEYSWDSGASVVTTVVIRKPGTVEVEWPLRETGYFRVVSGDATSESVPVTVIVPTSVVALDNLTLPKKVKRKASLRFAVKADVEYDDGVYRPIPIGTAFTIEFAPTAERSDAPGSRALTWNTAKRGQVKVNGIIKATTRAKKTGYWRIRTGDGATQAVRVTVRR